MSRVTPALSSALRRLTAVAGTLALTALGAVLLAAPASADVPVGWSDPDPVDPLHVVLVGAGLPLLGLLILAAAVYGPPLARGETLVQHGLASEAAWLGGPESKTRELPSGEDAPDSGGASGRW